MKNPTLPLQSDLPCENALDPGAAWTESKLLLGDKINEQF